LAGEEIALVLLTWFSVSRCATAFRAGMASDDFPALGEGHDEVDAGLPKKT
jgi:hypothetical protein